MPVLDRRHLLDCRYIAWRYRLGLPVTDSRPGSSTCLLLLFLCGGPGYILILYVVYVFVEMAGADVRLFLLLIQPPLIGDMGLVVVLFGTVPISIKGRSQSPPYLLLEHSLAPAALKNALPIVLLFCLLC